jgi:hypothetical protein
MITATYAVCDTNLACCQRCPYAREVGSTAAVLAVWLTGGVVALFGTFCYAKLAQPCQRRVATTFT